MIMIEIYLDVEGSELLFLSIPLDDIRRHALLPLKWLRFVTFAVCGARGDLSEMAAGPAVNYDTTFDDLASQYHYVPYEDFLFVDYNGGNDPITSSVQTRRRSDFRRELIKRDGPFCVVSGHPESGCDAAHIIPHSKGSEYINKVIRDRSTLYDNQVPEISDIDAGENGMLLRKDLHAHFARGELAFLKTPNFALDPGDIPKVGDGPTPPTRTTPQYLKEQVTRAGTAVDPFPDVVFGRPESAPPPILLDYVYGIAAYKRWRGGDEIHEVMNHSFPAKYKFIEPLAGPAPPDDGTDLDPSDDSRDEDFEPRTPPVQGNESSMWSGMLQAMDEMNFHIMTLKGITPEMRAAREREKEKEERKASCDKVRKWMNSTEPPKAK